LNRYKLINKYQKIKILLIQYKPIGDVLLSTPLIKVLKKNYPNSEITFLTGPAASQVLENNPHLDNILIFDKNGKDIIGGFLYFLRLRKYNFDLAIDIQGNFSTAWASFFSGAQLRVGYNLRGRRYLYNKKVSNITEDRYSSLKKFILLKRIGIFEEEEKPEIFLTEKETEFGKNVLNKLNVKEDDFIISVSPVSKRQARRWTKEGFAKLSDILISDYKAKVIMHWGPGEFDYVSDIVNKMNEKPVLLPKTCVREMASVIVKSKLMITNDNGPKHIAVALGVPTVTIFGPTNPKVWNPSDTEKHPYVRTDVDCIGCDKRECDNKICMERIKPEDVITKMDELKRKGII